MAIDVVGSKLPPENAYGQNGYHGPSSTTPGNRTRVEDLGGKPVADVSVPDNLTARIDVNTPGWQTRAVKAEQYPTTFGHHKANTPTTFPTSNDRRKASAPAKSGNYSRGK